jgi:hypothetical protein
MGTELVRRVAEVGVRRLPPDDLRSAAAEAREWGAATADARYPIISDTLTMIAEWFEEYGGALSTSFLVRVDAHICSELSDVLSADALDVACALATALHEKLATEALSAGDLRRSYD